MKMILCDPTGQFFTFIIVDAEPIKKMWRIKQSEDKWRIDKAVSPNKLMHYSDEVWTELEDIKRAKQEVWDRRLALRKFLVGGKQ